MRRTIFVLIALCACKKQEAVQQAAPTEGPLVAATVTTSAPVAPDPSAVASASATPHEHTEAEIEAERRAARQAALREAAEFGMLGALGSYDAGIEPWGREEGSLGNGTIGLGNIGTLGGGHRDGGTSTNVPRMRQGAVTVNGRLPPEVIQRIVRQNFGRFRLCYETGLRSNPSLQGRVAVKYTIDRDGSVKGAPQDGGSDLPDQGVVNCVIRGFQNLSYPQPEGGIVTVVFPLIFSPGS
jgi:hypothetical protein